MATLQSEETTIPSSIRLSLGELVRDGGRWISYSLLLESGGKTLLLEDEGEEIGRCLLALSPLDEVERLLRGLGRFLEGGKEFSFEPSEPNFELLFRREELGFSAYCFIDSGNQHWDHATWDGLGLRMFTTKEHLQRFHAQLDEEHRHALAGRTER
ncbi:MAG: hypothetical protein ACM3YO_01370 [Bacteroidota bacterium]